MFGYVAHLWNTWRGDRRMRKLLSATPATAIDDLAENTLGKLAGIAEPLDGRAIVAPLSGRQCVYFAFAIETRYQKSTPQLVAHDHYAIPFLLVHAGQRAIVDPTDAKVSVAFDYISEVATMRDVTPPQRKLLERYSLIHQGRRADWLVFREGVIELGEPIAVYGAGVREPDPTNAPGSGYRDSGRLRLKLTGTARFPLAISDDPRALDD